MDQQLVERLKQCQSLPTLPSIAMEVLELTQKNDVDIAEIARTISRDPALSTRILKTVNSSFYGRSKHVSTISNALVILGLQAVKTLVLGFSLVTSISKKRSGGFDHLTYWKRSIHAATAARVLAGRMKLVQQEEAFLSSLLMDLGMLALDQVMGESYGAICARATSHDQLAALEREALNADHAEVGGWLTAQWKLPPLLTTPIACHIACEQVSDAALRRLAELARLSGQCADVFVDADPAPAISAVRRLMLQEHGLPEGPADALLGEIGKQAREMASLFEIPIGAAVHYEAILNKANETLVEINLQSQQAVNALASRNQQLVKNASTDALTGLANRGALDKFLAEQFAMAVQQKRALSLLALDVDKFKSINDAHGHQAGDEVLKTLSRILMTAARPGDLAARYGGEEFCMALPNTGRAVAAALAEKIRAAVALWPLPAGKLRLAVTASFGVASLEPDGPISSVAHLVRAADLAVYAAKHAGRNRVKVFAAPKPSVAA